ncbi:hypothetical protein [Methylobrevis pamukkalensis]|uniref:Isoquinoline 1-oxidoreductase subunit beta n=1 Tax=Methylobrevis pamukkalensis TaxID=1439726 RepID=A0A1E3H858_9HYPH|nr:hypothetical protein [Methylobrevis pamukkalensis]ODN71681.1 Isoquinoline 1-oxidoreductase subunit beta [Methylobrevis pamukkalensis]
MDDTEAGAVAGLVKIVTLPYGVGVIGTTVEATRRAKDLLKVSWYGSSKASSYTSAERLDAYTALARNADRTGVAMRSTGDAMAAIAGADRVIEATTAAISSTTRPWSR